MITQTQSPAASAGQIGISEGVTSLINSNKGNEKN